MSNQQDSNVEYLYFGDARIGTLLRRVEDLVYDELTNADVCVLTAVGILENIKKRMMDSLDV